jgi:hypothetical protein
MASPDGPPQTGRLPEAPEHPKLMAEGSTSARSFVFGRLWTISTSNMAHNGVGEGLEHDGVASQRLVPEGGTGGRLEIAPDRSHEL